MKKFLDDYQLVDAIANRMRHCGIMQKSGNSVHEFLGNATPENAPRTIQRAVVSFNYNPLVALLDQTRDDLWSNGYLPFVIEFDSRTMTSTITVKTLRADESGNPLTLLTYEYGYFDQVSEMPNDVGLFLVRCLTEGDWASQNRNRTLLAPAKAAA